jgi:hypothetical protein
MCGVCLNRAEGRKMPGIKWKEVFSQRFPAKGATRDELQALVSTICKPFSEEECRSINAAQSNPFPETDPLHATYKSFDPRKWRPPSKPLPPSYMDFLEWSNGGSFVSGERRFDPFFSTPELRDYLVGYNVPEYMPDSLPFAFDGYGDFYLFDMRREPIEGEYPILFTLSGNLGYEDAILVASSFVEACKGTTNPNDLYFFGE